MQKECKFCKKQIEYNKKQYYASHVSNCKENPKRSKIRTSSIQYELSCKKCKTNYSVKITKNAFEKGKFTNYCSQSCANSRGPRSVEVKEKIRQSAKVSEKKKLTQIRKNAIYKEKQSIREVFEKECLYCKAAFFTYKNTRKFCKQNCSSKHNGKIQGSKNSNIKRSKNEIYFSQLCKEKFSTVLENVVMFNGWDADVILPNLKIAILWNGIWHYKKIKKQHSVLQVQNRDRLKVKEIIKIGYIPYIIKDLGSYNKSFVLSEFNKFLQYTTELKSSLPGSNPGVATLLV